MERRSTCQGFTLVEMLVVSALIALLSGIAIINIQNLYDSNRRKVTIAENFSIATALSIAHNDLQFFPRFNFLNKSRTQIFLDANGSDFGNDLVTPRLDYLGFLNTSPRILPRIRRNWRGPYGSKTPTSGAFVKMRLPDVTQTVEGSDLSLVNWPADVYGTPYVLYQFKADTRTGQLLPIFIEQENESADFFNAVVSYGPNKVPGGNIDSSVDYLNNTLEPGSLFVRGDATDPGGPAQFTLRTINGTGNLSLLGSYPAILGSLSAGAQTSVDDGMVGLFDDGNDDLVFEF